MNANQTRKTGSSLDAQIRAINLSDHSRNEALQAASIAEAIVDVFAWVIVKTVRQTRSKYAKPQYN